ncbi:Inner membrane ABC transporter permease protein YcjP [compost metagenome]
MYYKSKAYRLFNGFNYVFLILVAITCILPLWHLFVVSLSGKTAASTGQVGLFPVDFTLEAYTKTFSNSNFLRALGISLVRTVVGTSLSMILITMTGYALSKTFRGRNLYMWFFVITMLFGGGLIPSYILVTSLGLKNTLGALILPGALGVYNVILIMNFFKSIPRALEEAALIDGASFTKIFARIYIPLSMAGLATVGLFIMVGNWNSWFDGLLYISKTENYPLATFLQTIVVQNNIQDLATNAQSLSNLSERTIKAAQIFIGALPILMVYPFLQKYFVTGIKVGAVKE